MELLCRFRRVRTLLHRQEVNNIIRYVPNATSVRKLHTARPSCVRKDVVPLYDGHIHTSPLQKGEKFVSSLWLAIHIWVRWFSNSHAFCVSYHVIYVLEFTSLICCHLGVLYRSSLRLWKKSNGLREYDLFFDVRFYLNHHNVQQFSSAPCSENQNSRVVYFQCTSGFQKYNVIIAACIICVFIFDLT